MNYKYFLFFHIDLYLIEIMIAYYASSKDTWTVFQFMWLSPWLNFLSEGIYQNSPITAGDVGGLCPQLSPALSTPAVRFTIGNRFKFSCSLDNEGSAHAGN